MLLKTFTLLAGVSLTMGQGFGGFQIPQIPANPKVQGTTSQGGFGGLQIPQIPVDPNIDNIRKTIEGTGEKLLGTLRQQAEGLVEKAWGGFTDQFNKIYETAEESKFRREIFIENTNKIKRLNDDYGVGKYTFVQKVNEYADMLSHEFNNVLNGLNRITHSVNKNNTHKGSSFIPSANVAIPDSIDWTTLGAVTPVKSQGLCGGCYAFSAAGALEGHWFRKTGELKELSPQNLIDCTRSYENEGCEGGLMEPAFQYVKDNAGIDTLDTYPYEAKEIECRYKAEGLGATDTGFVSIPEGDENALKIAVATLGPVSVGIDASRESLQFYSDGVYFDQECKNDIENVNHAVLVVGYGTDPDGKEFWLVKNSYGTGWGIGGYIKMARNADNHCGIATIASYPLV